jgi:predicted RNA binding protein YcfA (HicA-like mRNA interferase family)
MKVVTGRELCRAVERKGWRLSRVKGSHHIYNRGENEPSLSIPVHAGTDLKPGIQRGLMKQAGLADADL